MNTGLKALLQVLFDSAVLVKGLVEKKTTEVMFPIFFKLLGDAPVIVDHWQDLLPEMMALVDGQPQDDLIQFVMSQVPTVVSSEQAQRVISASMALAQKAVELGKAIKG